MLLTGKNINKALLKIIEEAKDTLVIVSPYINLEELKGEWKIILEKLKEKSKAGIVKIHTRSIKDDFFNKGSKIVTKSYLCNIFNGLNHENIYFNNMLHAKLYFNEREVLITSMNLTTASIEKKIEIGYLTDNINECQNIKEQFFEKYLVEPYKEINKNIEYFKIKYLNIKYDDLILDYNKITIKNKNKSHTAFILECRYGMYMSNDQYLFDFKITANDDVVYSKIQRHFLEKYLDNINYHISKNEENKDSKTIIFSSKIIHAHKIHCKLNNDIFYNNDIMYVFCNEMLKNKFFEYINRVMKTLRNILYSPGKK